MAITPDENKSQVPSHATQGRDEAEPAAMWSDVRRQEGVFLLRTVSIVLAPLMVGVLAALFLAVPDQTLEIYRTFARDYAFKSPLPKHQSWPVVLQFLWARLSLSQIDLGFIGVSVAGVLNWLFARNLTLEFAERSLQGSDAQGVTLRWLPRLCGAIIPFGAGTGLIRAGADVGQLPVDLHAKSGVPQAAEVAENLQFVGYTFYAIAAVILIYAYWRTRNSRQKYRMANRVLFSAPVLTGVMVCTLGLIILFATALTGSIGVHAAWALGTPALFCLFIMLLAYYSSGMSIATLRTGVPVIPLVGLAVFLMALADLNDNHTVEVSPSTAALSQGTTREAFLQWYQNRADRTFYERSGKPYPVILVTAAGGGLYAADFAATGLARLQDACAAFAQHTFAISGVSGGGLGAAMFTTVVADWPQVRTEDIRGGDPCSVQAAGSGKSVEERVQKLIGQDYLAPMAAAGLFPDFAQRFLPWPIKSLDRANSFETTLDVVWQREHPDCKGDACAPFSRPFLDVWRPHSTVPALVLNATDVDLGYRTILAPFVIAKTVPGEYSALQNFHDELSRASSGAKGGDVTLGAAVGLSARFPWIMPAATAQLPGGKRKLRLLDGGIFENSGVDTLTDILIDLAEFETPPRDRGPHSRSEPWVRFHPLVISGYQLNSTEIAEANGLRGEALSPVSAMLAARVQRAGMASYRLFLQRGYDCGQPGQSPKCESGGLRFLVLNHVDFRLPLGWQLSTFSRKVVVDHVGKASRCDPIPTIQDMFKNPSAEMRQQYTQRENDCTACAIRHAIRGFAMSGGGLCKTSP